MDTNKKELYVIVTFGLVGCGKSSLYDIFLEQSKGFENKLNIFRISSDKHRAILIEQYLKTNKNDTFATAFIRLFKGLKLKFHKFFGINNEIIFKSKT